MQESDRGLAYFVIPPNAIIMAFSDLLVSEIFYSLQGETSLMGVPFAFIRLSGCNLRCTYCDSSFSFKGGKRMSIAEVIEGIAQYQVKHVLITGGEPLLQRQTPTLAKALIQHSYSVSIETNGEVCIQEVSSLARIVMDIKTPSSGMSRGGYRKNLPFLKPGDEIKFVIASQEDYHWSKSVVKSLDLKPGIEVLFSPALPAQGSPGEFSAVNARWLAESILEDHLPVRLQIQLHKLLWGANTRAV